MTTYKPSKQTRVKRRHERGHYDKETVYAILDAMPMGHVGYLIDGTPFVTPTLQWRVGNTLHWHGSAASRMLRQVNGEPACMTVSIFDGMVLARAPFHHSCNYRSVMAFGTARAIDARADKEAALFAMMEQFFPGRWDECRETYAKELKATTVIRMEIEEASAKIRSGPPIDDEEDYGTVPVWAGVVPVVTAYGPPQPDTRMDPAIPVPDYLRKVRLG